MSIATTATTSRPPKKIRLREKHPDRHQAIVKAATQIFATQGYAVANINRIADEVGVGVGTIYNYFDDKDDLFLSCVEAAAITDLRIKQERVDISLPVLGALRSIFRTDHELNQIDPDGQLLLKSVFYGVNSHLPVGKQAQEMYSGSIELVESVLVRGEGEGIFDRPQDRRILALLINGLMETFWVLQPFLGEDDLAHSSTPTERAFELLCRGIISRDAEGVSG